MGSRLGCLVVAAALALLAGPAHAQPAQPRTASPPSVVDQLLDVPEPAQQHHHHTLGYEADPLDPSEHLLGASANLLFTVTRLVTVVSLAVVEWAFELRVAGYLAEPVGTAVDAAQEELVGPLRLRHLVILLAVTWCGWQVLTNRAARGVAELGVSLLLAAGSAVVLASPGRVACGGVEVVRGLSLAVLALAHDDAAAAPPPRGDCRDVLADPPAVAAARAFTQGAFEAFAGDPHLLLNWGAVPPPGDACREIMEQLRRERVWDTEPEPRDRIRAVPGCEPYAAFNGDMTVDRTAGALISAAAAVVFFLPIVVLAGVLLVAQVAGLLLVMLMPFALAAGVAPDLGRQLLLRWALAVAKAALVILLVALLLAFVVTAWNAIAAATSGSLAERYLLGCALGGGALALTRRVVSAGRTGAVAAKEVLG